MKIFYLARENFECVIFADNEIDAFEKMQIKNKPLFDILDLPKDIDLWYIEEFTPDLYDGSLCFY